MLLMARASESSGAEAASSGHIDAVLLPLPAAVDLELGVVVMTNDVHADARPRLHPFAQGLMQVPRRQVERAAELK